jgi:FtsZ-interacting cell division protein ZipA
MQLLIIILVAFVIFISIHTVWRNHKRRKRLMNEKGGQLAYKRRLGQADQRFSKIFEEEEPINVTKYNSKVDYRAPGGNSQEEDVDYSEWGE